MERSSTRLAATMLFVVLSGCVTSTGQSPGPVGPTGPAPSRAPDTPWDAEVRDVSPEGERSLESALRLFAMAYGPLPGVEGVPDSTERVEGTIARRAARAHYDEMTVEQQAAVDAWLAPDPDATVVVIGPVDGSSASTSLGVAAIANLAQAAAGAFAAAAELTPLQQAIVDATDDYRTAIAAKIGDIAGPIKVSFPNLDRPDARADADGIWTGGTYNGCEIRWFTAGLTDEPLDLLLTVAHETFHCFQAANIGAELPYLKAPDWYQEGGAEWVSYDIAGAPQDGGFWDHYVDDPETPLFQRTYDGVGFWADLAATGIDPWPKWTAIWAGYENEGAWVASGGEADAFLDSWASGWFRDASRGPAWDMTGPGIPSGSSTPESVSVANGASASVAASAYANAQYTVTSAADVVLVTGNGHIRLSDGTVDEPLPIGQHFCTKPGGCQCPDGKPPPYPVTPLAPAFVVAVTGGNSGASGNLAGVKLEDACKPEEENQAVMVTIDRPGSPGVLPGTVVDLISCDGPYGPWSGVFRTGGLDNNGFVVPWTDLPVEFTMPAEGGVQTAVTTTSAIVPTPIGPLPLDYVVTVTVTGGTMTIVLEPGAEGMGNKLVDMPILPAPEGACPGSGG